MSGFGQGYIEAEVAVGSCFPGVGAGTICCAGSSCLHCIGVVRSGQFRQCHRSGPLTLGTSTGQCTGCGGSGALCCCVAVAMTSRINIRIFIAVSTEFTSMCCIALCCTSRSCCGIRIRMCK